MYNSVQSQQAVYIAGPSTAMCSQNNVNSIDSLIRGTQTATTAYEKKTIVYNVQQPTAYNKSEYISGKTISSGGDFFSQSFSQSNFQTAGYQFSNGAQTISENYISQTIIDNESPTALSNHEYILFTPSEFLEQGTAPFEVVNDLEDLAPIINEAFKKTTNIELPASIKIKLCTFQELKKIHQYMDGWWADGIQGFALNRKGRGTSEIFVKKGPKDEVLLTIGHELGHVITPQLKAIKDEETKAFAFSMAWIDTIVKNNIAGLSKKLHPRPANNGIHDAAYSFVLEQLNNGKSPLQVFMAIAKGELSCENMPEQIIIAG